MITSCISCCIFRRRHLARSSKMLIPGVSSMKMGASLRCSIEVCSCCHSYSSNWPLRSLLPEISASSEMRRCTSWMFDISREKIATGFLKSTAALRVSASTKEVLPIPGRAAMMTRSDACQPEVSRSSAVKPVGIPVSPSSRSFSSSSCLSALVARAPMFSTPRLRFCWVMLNSPFSASSSRLNTSVVSS